MRIKFIPAATALFLLLTAAVAFLGWRAKVEVEGVAVEQFNRQQLILAEKIAIDIEENFDFLRIGLKTLAQVWGRNAADPGHRALSIATFYEILKEGQVLAAGFAEKDGSVILYGPLGAEETTPDLAAQDCRDCPDLRRVAPGKIVIGPVFAPDSGRFKGRLIMILATGVSGGGRSGGLFLVVDPVAVARRYAHGIVSGKTGYAWVIDGQGVFLDHFEENFIGRPSLEVHRARSPNISWDRLTWLVSHRILRGDRGSDWYLSGWHRGRGGEIKKYVAYCPAYLSGRGAKGSFWGVAVAAPESEVQGVIGRLMTREIAILGLFEAVVAFGFVATLFFALRWSHSLQREVDKKTSELLGAQEKLLRSGRFAAIGEAAAHLSHEIKNPLMLMGGFAGQVRKSLPEGRDAEKLKIIEDEAKRLEAMLVEVRDFTRPNPPSKESGDLNALAEDVLRLMEDRLSDSGIAVDKELDPRLERIGFDPAQIKQVLINLIKNAVEAMGDGGTLTVVTEAAPGGAKLTVRDSGPGVSEEIRSKIFEPFCTTKEAGTGLGLSVCARILEDHGGDLTCDSAPGEGAAFTMTLPGNGGNAGSREG